MTVTDAEIAAITKGVRVTPAMIEAAIDKEHYFVVPGTTLTVCALVLKNGFTAVGEAACADPANFNAEIGQRLAREHAIGKIWPAIGFALCERLRPSIW